LLELMFGFTVAVCYRKHDQLRDFGSYLLKVNELRKAELSHTQTQQQQQTLIPLHEPTAEIMNMQIFVNTSTNVTLCIRIVSLESFTIELMKSIHIRVTIVPTDQLLVFAGKVLKENVQLVEYGIHNNSTVQLHVKKALKGGTKKRKFSSMEESKIALNEARTAKKIDKLVKTNVKKINICANATVGNAR
jgi:hypothetical protein